MWENASTILGFLVVLYAGQATYRQTVQDFYEWGLSELAGLWLGRMWLFSWLVCYMGNLLGWPWA